MTEPEKQELHPVEDRHAIAQMMGILGNADARVVYYPGENRCTVRSSYGEIAVVLDKNDSFLEILHEAGHAKFSPWDFEDTLKSVLSDPRVMELANAIEDARVDLRTSLHFGKPVYETRKPDVASQTENSDDPIHTVKRIAYGLSKRADATPEQLAIETQFRDDVQLAVSSNDQMAAPKLAIRIAYFLKMLEEAAKETETSPEEDKDGEKIKPSPGSGSLGIKGVMPDPDGAPDGAPTESSDDPPSYTSDSEDDKPPEPPKAPPPPPKPDLKERLKKLEDTERETEDLFERIARPKLKKVKEVPAGKPGSGTKGSGSGMTHEFEYLQVMQEPTVLTHEIRGILKKYAGSGEYTGRKRTGYPRPDAWKLSHGDTKVFSRPPKRKGDVVIMVDLSGSMGDWCQNHKCKGWLAFQAANAIAKGAGGKVLMFGFCSSRMKNFIVPLTPGYQPVCRIAGPVPEGNPDCVALEYLDYVARVENCLAVIVSDGSPGGPAPLSEEHLTSHTKKLVDSFTERGLKFASVLINCPTTIYPSTISVKINSTWDLMLLAPFLKQFKALQEGE